MTKRTNVLTLEELQEIFFERPMPVIGTRTDLYYADSERLRQSA